MPTKKRALGQQADGILEQAAAAQEGAEEQGDLSIALTYTDAVAALSHVAAGLRDLQAAERAAHGGSGEVVDRLDAAIETIRRAARAVHSASALSATAAIDTW